MVVIPLDLGVGYKDFCSRDTREIEKQIPLLREEGMALLSTAQLMKRRLNAPRGKIRQAWRQNYFDTGDVFIYGPNKTFKVCLDYSDLGGLTTGTVLRKGALILTTPYEEIEAEEFSRELTGQTQTKEEAKKDPVWRILARGDQHLLNEYIESTFRSIRSWEEIHLPSIAKNKHFRPIRGMNIIVPDAYPEPALARHVHILSMRVGSAAGSLYQTDLSDPSVIVARFVGVRHSLEEKKEVETLEERV